MGLLHQINSIVEEMNGLPYVKKVDIALINAPIIEMEELYKLDYSFIPPTFHGCKYHLSITKGKCHFTIQSIENFKVTIDEIELEQEHKIY